jgi:hypothetical protein
MRNQILSELVICSETVICSKPFDRNFNILSMPNDIKQLVKAVKNKDTKKLKANPIFIIQLIFSSVLLAFCLIALFTRRFKDNETILWSVITGILGTYAPTSHINEPKPAALPPVPNLNTREKSEDYGSVDYYSV